MSDLPLFDAAETPVTWRRQGEGTFFFIQSREPDCYEIRGMGKDGHMAKPGKAALYLAWYFHPQRGILKSPHYPTVGAAKAACDHHHLHGTWPPLEKHG